MKKINWQKVLSWALNIIALLSIILYFNGNLNKYGLYGILTAMLLFIGSRMYKQRHALKNLYGMVGNIGRKHKEVAKYNKQIKQHNKKIIKQQKKKNGI